MFWHQPPSTNHIALFTSCFFCVFVCVCGLEKLKHTFCCCISPTNKFIYGCFLFSLICLSSIGLSLYIYLTIYRSVIYSFMYLFLETSVSVYPPTYDPSLSDDQSLCISLFLSLYLRSISFCWSITVYQSVSIHLPTIHLRLLINHCVSVSVCSSRSLPSASLTDCSWWPDRKRTEECVLCCVLSLSLSLSLARSLSLALSLLHFISVLVCWNTLIKDTTKLTNN